MNIVRCILEGGGRKDGSEYRQIVTTTSIVISFGEDLFACWAKKNGVFELRHVRALDVAQRRVSIDQTHVTEVVKGS